MNSLQQVACLCLVILGISVTTQASIITDNFNRTENSNLVGSTTSDGNATWEGSTVYPSSMVINASGQATNPGSAAVNYISIAELPANSTLIVEADISLQSASWGHIILGNNLDNMWGSDGWMFQADIAKSGATRQLKLATRYDGTIQDNTPTFATLADAGMHHFTLVYNRAASTISLTVDSFIVADDFALPHDYIIHDIGFFTQSSSLVDDFSVQVVPEPASMALMFMGAVLLCKPRMR